jgi:hypothetical protein
LSRLEEFRELYGELVLDNSKPMSLYPEQELHRLPGGA